MRMTAGKIILRQINVPANGFAWFFGGVGGKNIEKGSGRPRAFPRLRVHSRRRAFLCYAAGDIPYAPALIQRCSFRYFLGFLSSSFSFEQAGTKEKEAKRKCRKGKRQRKLFEKSFLWTPSKTFGQLPPESWVLAALLKNTGWLFWRRFA